jgi:hypothetical protein
MTDYELSSRKLVSSQPLDGYELNLFAAKPDRADALAKDSLLVHSVSDWAPRQTIGDAYEKALEALRRGARRIS